MNRNAIFDQLKALAPELIKPLEDRDRIRERRRREREERRKAIELSLIEAREAWEDQYDR